MKKCILLVRVSTERQSFDEQELQLFNLALNDGYAESNIIPICEIESGIKLDENERKGLNKMKELIESDSSIDCVYSWECSRIARRKKILFSILEYLTDRKIQLVIKDPYLKLLNDDGSINDSAETSFTLYAQMSESEMRNKNARFKRAKERMKRNYQYRGGWLPVGYKVQDGYIVIDEEQAAVVRLIFSLYNEGVSTYKMTSELQSRGYEYSLSYVRHILSNENYCNGLYPLIISKEIWDKKCEVAKANNTLVDKSRNNYYFAAKLIKCSCCGRSYVASTSVANYVCVGKYRQNSCTNTKGISINLLDSLLWYVAKIEYILFLADDNEKKREKLAEEKEILIQKLNALDLLFEKIDKKEQRSKYLFKNLNIELEEYQNDILQYNRQRNELNNNKINYENEIERINSILSSNNNCNLFDDDERNDVLNQIIKIDDKITLQHTLNVELDKINDENKYNIVHQFVKNVTIDYINVDLKLVTITTLGFDGDTKIFKFNVYPKRKNNNEKIEWADGVGIPSFTTVYEQFQQYANDRTIAEKDTSKYLDGFKFITRIQRKPVKDIAAYRIKHNEYARNYRKKQKEKGAK